MNTDLLKSVLTEIQSVLSSAGLARVTHLANNLESLPEKEREHWEQEPKIRNQIDVAIEHWIVQGSWPAMNPDDAIYLWERLNEASLFGGYLLSVGFEAQNSDRAKILRFLLIGLWDGYGCHRIPAALRENS